MDRLKMMQNMETLELWDILIIGGGATGLGAAVDAASRGFRTLLLEQSDFAKGTSSRSTKLIHGGLRYLQQGNISLVTEALKERGLLYQNAPHLVHSLPFLVPNYHWWEGPFYGIGLKIYDRLAGKYGLERSKHLTRAETLSAIPTLEPKGLRGGVIYYDGQFDDSRLAIALAQTAADQGATLLNYMKVTKFIKKKGACIGVEAIDQETGTKYSLLAQAIINATGVFSDEILQLDEPKAKTIISPSQGIHLVLDRSFQPSSSAILVPHTEDKRVLFFVPWLDRVLVGTTDTPVSKPSLEPKPLKKEIDFLLKYAAKYLTKDPTYGDILSAFAGLRPLIKTKGTKNTAALSRDHAILIAKSGLITIAGGKWTTYRKMAEDVIDQAIIKGRLPKRPCITQTLKLKKAGELDKKNPLHPKFPYFCEDILYAVRNEMARTLEDVLARRTRFLLLDAKASIEIAPLVAKIMAQELKYPPEWEKNQVLEYSRLAKQYCRWEV